LGRGAHRVVLPVGGRAGLAALAMDAHTWQHETGREVVHRRLPAAAADSETGPAG